jgi:hypothetical protein
MLSQRGVRNNEYALGQGGMNAMRGTKHLNVFIPSAEITEEPCSGGVISIPSLSASAPRWVALSSYLDSEGESGNSKNLHADRVALCDALTAEEGRGTTFDEETGGLLVAVEDEFWSSRPKEANIPESSETVDTLESAVSVF